MSYPISITAVTDDTCPKIKRDARLKAVFSLLRYCFSAMHNMGIWAD